MDESDYDKHFDRDDWDSVDDDKDIFDHRVPGGRVQDVLNQRFANYVTDLFSSSSYTVKKFLQRNRFTLHNPDLSPELNWTQQKPTPIKDKTGLPVPPLNLTVFIDRHADRPAYTPFELKLVVGNYDAAAREWSAWKSGEAGILSTTLQCVQFAPPELFYSAAQMSGWDQVLEKTSDQKVKAKMIGEFEERLNLARTLTEKEDKYTREFVPPDYYSKPCLLELLAPKKPGMPKMMLTSVMSGSLLCFRPHPKKDDGSLVLCHITGASSGMGMLPKAFQRECIKRCSLWKESLDAIKGIGLWGPLQYGGDPTNDTPLAGTSTVIAIWNDEAKQWRLFAQIFNAKTDQLAGVVQIYGPGTQPLDIDWLAELSKSYNPKFS